MREQLAGFPSALDDVEGEVEGDAAAMDTDDTQEWEAGPSGEARGAGTVAAGARLEAAAVLLLLLLWPPPTRPSCLTTGRRAACERAA